MTPSQISTSSPPPHSFSLDDVMKHSDEFSYSLDICSAIPYFSMDEKQRREIWLSDALHLTAKGYKLMGEIVADRLVGILKDKLR